MKKQPAPPDRKSVPQPIEPVDEARLRKIRGGYSPDSDRVVGP